MKKVLFFIIFLCCSVFVFSQVDTTGSIKYYYIKDSIVWKITDIKNIGTINCVHQWVDSPVEFINDNVIKFRICKLCKRKEKLKERIYEHQARVPKTEYELLDETITK